MYFDDHNPPHFHIVTPDSEAIVSIESLEVIRGQVLRHDYELAVEWVRGNIDTVRAEWDRLNAK